MLYSCILLIIKTSIEVLLFLYYNIINGGEKMSKIKEGFNETKNNFKMSWYSFFIIYVFLNIILILFIILYLI